MRLRDPRHGFQNGPLGGKRRAQRITGERDQSLTHFAFQGTERSAFMVEHTQPIQIDAAILQEYVDALGSIGWQADGGIIRPVYSAAWVHARGQVAQWMRAAGLEVRGDTVGNLFGRLRGGDGSRTILTGSHLDTVPLGGKFDGALGILAGLVALRSLLEQAGQPRRSLEVVALCEEEGSRFPAHYWGTIRADELERLRD